MPIPIRTLGDVRDRKRRDSQQRFLAQHSLAPPNAPSFFPSSLSPTPFNACCAGYIIVAKFCSQTSLYRIGLHVGGLPFFKCDEMRLRWVFIVQTEVILLKNIFEFDRLYTGRAGGSSGGKGFNNIFSNIFTVCSTWLKDYIFPTVKSALLFLSYINDLRPIEERDSLQLVFLW